VSVRAIDSRATPLMIGEFQVRISTGQGVLGQRREFHDTPG
jgi:hypothetical protein